MSIRYELQEFFDDTLDRSEDFGFQVADQARRAICSVWQTTPGAIIPNPGDSFRRGLVSSLCQDFPPPPPPAVPFLGGQCPGALYDVSASTSSETLSGTLPSTGTSALSAVKAPIRPEQRIEGGSHRVGVIDGDGVFKPMDSVNTQFRRITSFTITSVTPLPGQPNNCGNPDPIYPGRTVVYEGDTIIEGDTIVEGDENNPITIDISPTFGDESCVGVNVLCVDVEGNRVNLDLGGITVNLPGTGGGDSGGGSGGDSETITNIDNRTTIIQNQQEECCAAIIQSISSFRNRATELFNEAELRDACIVGLIRNSTEKVPRFEGGATVRASGTTGVLGSVRVVQPSGGDSCFLRIDITPTEAFKGKRYKILEDSQLNEASYGHAELVFLDGTTVPPSEAGIRTLSQRRSYIWFPYISSGNAIRLSLAGGLDYTVTDPGFRWRPSDLPQCEELVEPA